MTMERLVQEEWVDESKTGLYMEDLEEICAHCLKYNALVYVLQQSGRDYKNQKEKIVVLATHPVVAKVFYKVATSQK